MRAKKFIAAGAALLAGVAIQSKTPAQAQTTTAPAPTEGACQSYTATGFADLTMFELCNQGQNNDLFLRVKRDDGQSLQAFLNCKANLDEQKVSITCFNPEAQSIESRYVNLLLRPATQTDMETPLPSELSPIFTKAQLRPMVETILEASQPYTVSRHNGETACPGINLPLLEYPDKVAEQRNIEVSAYFADTFNTLKKLDPQSMAEAYANLVHTRQRETQTNLQHIKDALHAERPANEIHQVAMGELSHTSIPGGYGALRMFGLSNTMKLELETFAFMAALECRQPQWATIPVLAIGQTLPSKVQEQYLTKQQLTKPLDDAETQNILQAFEQKNTTYENTLAWLQQATPLLRENSPGTYIKFMPENTPER